MSSSEQSLNRDFDPPEAVAEAIGIVVMSFGNLDDAFTLAFRTMIPLSPFNAEIIKNGAEFGARINIFEASYKEQRATCDSLIAAGGLRTPEYIAAAKSEASVILDFVKRLWEANDKRNVALHKRYRVEQRISPVKEPPRVVGRYGRPRRNRGQGLHEGDASVDELSELSLLINDLNADLRQFAYHRLLPDDHPEKVKAVGLHIEDFKADSK